MNGGTQNAAPRSRLTVGGTPDTAGAMRTALVLSGGGARGAYQVGVLRGLVHHGFLPRDHSALQLNQPFVGAIDR